MSEYRKAVTLNDIKNEELSKVSMLYAMDVINFEEYATRVAKIAETFEHRIKAALENHVTPKPTAE